MPARTFARHAARALALVLALAVALPAAFAPQASAREHRATRLDVRITGTITSVASRQPVEGAQVLVEGKGVRAVTDSAGHFRLTVPNVARGARLTLTVRRIGYRSAQQQVTVADAEAVVNVALAASTQTLQQHVVLAEPGRAREVRKGARTENVVTHDVRVTAAVAQSMQGVVGLAAPRPNEAPGATAGVLDSIRRRSADWNTEDYARIEDNPFLGAKSNPLSTFSIDVDRASYANVRRFLAQGQRPPKDAVRIEELVNYFRYDYASPDGRHPLAVYTEVAPAPWQPEHRLMRIGVQGRKVDLRSAPANNLVFLIDVSGSMTPANKLSLLKRAFRLLVDEMREQDRVSIVVYAGAAGLVLPPTSGEEKAKIHAALEQLSAGGSTAGGAGIQLAYDVARKHFVKGGNNRVILATDGDFNVGVSSDGELVRMVEERRREGTFLTVLGFGMGNYKDNRLEQLADKGNGNYAYIDDLLEARKVLVTEMGGTLLTIAKDVKLQVEFNPARVAGYRLLGYENRLLRAEDFDDDRKDAGELGAGHTVTALYEIVPVGAKSGVVLRGVDSLRYTRPAPAAGGATELGYVKLRYKQPDGETSRLLEHTIDDRTRAPSADFTFAAAVAGFGMLLRDSEYKGHADWKLVASLARAGKGEDAEGYRAEFIRLVDGLAEKPLARADER